MKEAYLLDSGTWSIGDKPTQDAYDGVVHVLENGVWEIEALGLKVNENNTAA